MNTASLIDLMSRFYAKGFSFKQAYERFGPVAEDEGEWITLQPKSGTGIEDATLETLAVEGQPEPFLAGISLEFEKPITLDFADLVRRFGTEKEIPRLKPDQDIRYQFAIQGEEYAGYLLLMVPDGSNRSKRPVSSLILRRFPPTG